MTCSSLVVLHLTLECYVVPVSGGVRDFDFSCCALHIGNCLINYSKNIVVLSCSKSIVGNKCTSLSTRTRSKPSKNWLNVITFVYLFCIILSASFCSGCALANRKIDAWPKIIIMVRGKREGARNFV